MQMQGYLRERGDINIKRPHPSRKIADKIFIVQPGGRFVHCQITRSPPYTEIQRLELSLRFKWRILFLINVYASKNIPRNLKKRERKRKREQCNNKIKISLILNI